MNIPLPKLLEKMEKELNEAKLAKSESLLKERIYAIKTLCDLVLEEKIEAREKDAFPRPVIKTNNIQETKLEEIDANGDSIFDF